MFQQCGVLILRISIRFLKGFKCFFVLTLFEQNPSETVEVGWIIRLRFHSNTDHFLCLFEVLALICIKVTQIVVDSGIGRVFIIDLLENLLSLLHVAALHVRVREAHFRKSDGVFFNGVKFQNLLVLFDSVLPLIKLSVDPCKTQM